MVFVCHVTLEDHVIKALNNFVVRSPSGKIVVLPSLVAMDTVVVEIKQCQLITSSRKTT